jgi:hypothetical protein
VLTDVSRLKQIVFCPSIKLPVLPEPEVFILPCILSSCIVSLGDQAIYAISFIRPASIGRSLLRITPARLPLPTPGNYSQSKSGHYMMLLAVPSNTFSAIMRMSSGGAVDTMFCMRDGVVDGIMPVPGERDNHIKSRQRLTAS